MIYLLANGITVTTEEENMIQINQLEYSFQLHLRAQKDITDISLAHTFFEAVTQHDKSAQFLAWNVESTQVQHPTVTHQNPIFQAIRGPTKLRHYLGNYNKNKEMLYSRVKIRTQLSFGKLKDIASP